MKRWVLFIATNILVVMTISVLAQVFGLNRYMSAYGMDYMQLAKFCLLYGMVGSFISLALSRVMAKMMMGVKVIDPSNAGQYDRLVKTVHRLAEKAGLPAMPEVGVYESGELNAFATGPTKSRSLVAVSTGLLSSMSQDEIDGVLGHEIAHIANGDMVTMTLIQGIVNAFVMFISRVIAYAVSQGVKEENRYMVMSLVTIVLQMVIGMLGMMVVAWFSRQREFRADAGSAKLLGASPMIAGLRALQRRYEGVDNRAASLEPFKIAGKERSGLMSLFATHPPLEERLAALKAA